MGNIKPSSTNALNRKRIVDFCGMMYAAELLGGRWKLLILFKLGKKRQRFHELKKLLPGVSDRVLSLQLRQLEKDKLVTRTVFAEVPPRVEYALTEIAERLLPVWQQLEQWGLQHRAYAEDNGMPAATSTNKHGKDD